MGQKIDPVFHLYNQLYTMGLYGDDVKKLAKKTRKRRIVVRRRKSKKEGEVR